MSSSETDYFGDIIIIWLDEFLPHPEKLLLSQRKTLLLYYIKSICPFVNSLECREYIERMKNVQIAFVVSGSLGQETIPIVHDLAQIKFIYIFCADKSKHDVWSAQFNKIRGVFIDDVPLGRQLKDDLSSLLNTNLPFGIFDSSQQTSQDLTKEQAAFMWGQLIIEVLLRLPQTPEGKAEMIKECRDSYKDNNAQLEKIMIFEKMYRANDAIRWYTDNSFVFQVFNKAFRQQDFQTIFKYRYFLVDLFKQLNTLYEEQYKNKNDTITVYRGQLMFKDELIKLKQNIGHLISINTFLSTSTACAVAADFSGDGEYESKDIVSVVFEITVDLAIQCRPLARIDQQSCMKDEREVLLSMGTIFQIDSVEMETNTIWYVKLTWTNDANEKFTAMKQLREVLDFYIQQNIGDHPSILTFGFFLSKMGLLREAMRFYTYLNKTLSLDHPNRCALHNNLGEVLRKLDYFNLAQSQFEKAIEYCADTFSFHHPFWAVLHSNMALLHLSRGNPKQAVKFYNYALFIFKKMPDMDDWRTTCVQEHMASVYHGIGSAYCQLEQCRKALSFHEKALEIELRILPCDHPTLIETYHELGRTYISLNELGKALNNFQQCLRIAETNLLVKDGRMAMLHVNIAVLVYVIDRDVPRTLLHCTRAQELINQLTAPNGWNEMIVYKTLAHLHTLITPGYLALQMWERYISVSKQRFATQYDCTDLSNMIDPDDKLRLSEEYPKMLIIDNGDDASHAPLSRHEMVTRCEIADAWRAMGYIKQAIYYYHWLLENFPVAQDADFKKVHISRLCNNLATCYQDLDEDQKALKYYRLALNILSPDEEHKSMQVAIIHYNIALIYLNTNELQDSRVHLEKSLSHWLESENNEKNALDFEIYVAFAKTYERSNDWQMARDYYDRAICQIKQNAPDNPIIEKYEKQLQYVTDQMDKNT